ncbi:MAG: M48 family metallopeptidase [Thermoanaerobaculum sp.]|nr:M48 family metallopeptidase [Thermoanaerobaculum sp.]
MWELIRANQRRSNLLMGAMGVLLLATGWAVGETVFAAPVPGVLVAAGLWLVQSEVALRSGHKLLMLVSRARPVSKQDHPILFNVVEEMSVASGLPRPPEVYILDEDAPNAFAAGMGPERAAVAVTAGLLERLTRDELQGVIAHEISHIKHRDVRYLTLMAVMAGSVVILADFARRVLFFGGVRRRTSANQRGAAPIYLVALVLILIAPLVARLMYLALSRRREFLADAGAAAATRYPEGLASALEKIERYWSPMANANPATAPMFIVNPLVNPLAAVETLFSTHPPTAQRVRILRSLAGTVSFAAFDQAFRQVTGRPVGVVPAAALRQESVPVRQPSSDPRTALDRLRQTTDLLWRLGGYSFIPCPCGTTLKVPPIYRGQTLPCPHCATPHPVVAPASSPQA